MMMSHSELSSGKINKQKLFKIVRDMCQINFIFDLLMLMDHKTLTIKRHIFFPPPA